MIFADLKKDTENWLYHEVARLEIDLDNHKRRVNDLEYEINKIKQELSRRFRNKFKKAE